MKLMTVSMCAIALLAAAAQADVTNGDFETGDFTGWTQFGTTNFTFVGGTVNTTAPAGGLAQAIFGPTAPGGISQQVTAGVGDQLTVSFALANNPFDSEPTDAFSCVFDGSTLMSVENMGALPYTVYSFNVTVGNANPTLVFTFFNSPDYYLLDNVSVTTTPTPAPGAAAALGLGGLASLRRRRR